MCFQLPVQVPTCTIRPVPPIGRSSLLSFSIFHLLSALLQLVTKGLYPSPYIHRSTIFSLISTFFQLLRSHIPNWKPRCAELTVTRISGLPTQPVFSEEWFLSQEAVSSVQEIRNTTTTKLSKADLGVGGAQFSKEGTFLYPKDA